MKSIYVVWCRKSVCSVMGSITDGRIYDPLILILILIGIILNPANE